MTNDQIDWLINCLLIAADVFIDVFWIIFDPLN